MSGQTNRDLLQNKGIDASREVFSNRWRSYRRLVEFLRPTDFSQEALYLSGYVIECRLKDLICQARGAADLGTAFDQINASRGTRFRVLQEGHNLENLWRLAAVHVHAEEEILRSTRTIFQWTPNWRYSLNAEVKASARDYWAAYDTLVPWLDGKHPQR